MKDFLIQTREVLNLEPWLFQLITICVSAILARVLVIYFLRYAGKAANLTSSFLDDSLVKAARAPMLTLVWFISLKLAVDVLIKRFHGPDFIWFSFPILKVGITLAVAWLLTRFVNYSADAFVKSGRIEQSKLDHTTTGAISKLAKLAILLVTLLVIAQNLGFSISGILAAGGAGGLILGFAAKDLLANLFGGLMIYLDRPFNVGDWIICHEKGVEGTVEFIGWRHTRVRALNANAIYVPNSIFTTVVVENPSRMTHRRINETIGIRYCDIDKMDAITADVKLMLDQHPDIDDERSKIVSFQQFNNSSVDFLVYAFTQTITWPEYAKIKQDVLLKVAKIVAKHQAEFAFPTRTLYVEKNEKI